MRKMDIQVDIAREIEGKSKEDFHQDLKRLLEKYFELNSIQIRKEVHTIEVETLTLKEKEHVMPETIEIEREPLVQVFADASKESGNNLPQTKKEERKKVYF